MHFKTLNVVFYFWHVTFFLLRDCRFIVIHSRICRDALNKDRTQSKCQPLHRQNCRLGLTFTDVTQRRERAREGKTLRERVKEEGGKEEEVKQKQGRRRLRCVSHDQRGGSEKTLSISVACCVLCGSCNSVIIMHQGETPPSNWSGNVKNHFIAYF